MSVIAADFVTRLSGGASNAVGNSSLGGVKSSNAASSTVDLLFDAVTAAQAAAGLVEYRCVYLHNANASLTMTAAKAYISANCSLANTTIDIGVGSAAINGTEQTVANEGTAPTGITFSAPSSAAAGIALGDIPAGQHIAIWIRRTITAGAGATPSDTYTLGYQCETV
jgi:hypothetical protein